MPRSTGAADQIAAAGRELMPAGVCLARGCDRGTVLPVILCDHHLGLLSRTMRCALKRAWLSAPPDEFARVALLAVREAEHRDTIITAVGG